VSAHVPPLAGWLFIDNSATLDCKTPSRDLSFETEEDASDNDQLTRTLELL